MESLALTAFEQYMIEDDRPDFPMKIGVRLQLGGEWNEVALQQAIHAASERHPLFGCRLDAANGRLAWVPTDDAQAAWQRSPGDPMDLKTGSGVGVRFAPEGECHTLYFDFHHALTDGKGIFQFVEDVLTIYANQQGQDGAPFPLPERNATLLKLRARHGLVGGRLLRVMAKQLLVGSIRSAKFLWLHPRPLLRGAHPDDVQDSEPYAPINMQINADEFAALRSVARAMKVTVNELLCRDLLRTIAEFVKRHDEFRPAEWIRLNVPYNLRRAEDQAIPAANIVSMVFLERQMKDLESPNKLLDWVHREMGFLRRWELTLTYVLCVSLVRWIPGAFRLVANSPRCMATCLFSNLGEALSDSPLPRSERGIEVGEGYVQSVDFVAPLRPGTVAGLTVTGLSGRLNFVLSYDPQHVSRSQGREFIQLFREHILLTTKE